MFDGTKNLGPEQFSDYIVRSGGVDNAYTTEDAGLQIIAAQASYGPALTGSLGIARQFTLNNLTQRQLTAQLALPRQFVQISPAGPPCGGLAPGASCNFTVAFLPLTHGDITGTLFAQTASSNGTLDGIGYVEGYGVATGTLAITGNLQAGNQTGDLLRS